MEIWKIGDNGWVKNEFRTEGVEGPVINFFDSQFPTLCKMVLDELRKDTGQRWVVFSKEEGQRIYEIGSIFVTPECNAGNALFLNAVLKLVKDCNRRGFAVIYIHEDDPRGLVLLDSVESLRLAIQIFE